ncbi:MAG: DUF4013 domain-containing protein, partial [Halobacteriota archaeon]
MLREGLSAPVRARDSVGTLVIGGVLTLLSIVFLPAWVLFAVLEPTIALVSTPIVVFPTLLLRGYALRVIDAAIRSKSTTPSFVRWGSLARDGLKSIVLSGVYLVPAGCFALLSGGAMLLLSADLTGMNAIGQLGTAMSGGIAALVALSYLLVYLYIRPAAEAVLSTTGRFKDALSPRIVLGTAAKGDFATGWVLSVFVILVGGVIGLSTIVVLVGGVLLFGIRVVAANLLGQGASSTLAPPTHSGVGPTAGTSQQPRSSTHAHTETVRSKAKAPVPPVSDADEWKSEPDADVQVGRPL